MGQHIEEMEQLLRDAFPGRDDDFYECGKWGGGALNSDAFEKLSEEEQNAIESYLRQLGFFSKISSMKKILIFLVFGWFNVSVFAQSNSLYVIFMESTNAENRIRHNPWGSYDTLFYRYEPHSFRVKQSGVVRSFSYANLNSQPDDPVQIQPESFLESIDYIDWNDRVMNYSTQEFYNFLNSLDSYDKVYFIDRAEIKDGMMKLYPVKVLKSRY